MAPSSAYKDKPSPEVLVVNGRWISYAHTAVAYTAFIAALIVGMNLHFHKIVKNQYYGYPDEWFPSVSATIGDRYPERSVFQFFIAITSGPRFALVGLWYLLTAQAGHSVPKYVALMGILRTVTCGGWTYITSTDDHDWHDILMVSYIIATLPWTIGCIYLSPPNARAIKYRKYLACAFFGTLVPLIYYFIQHKVHRVAGAYTTYAFLEWSLILFDIAFDAVTALDYSTFELVVRDVKGVSKGVAASRSTNGKAVENEIAKPSAFVRTQFSVHPAIDFVAEVFHGYVFWSMLTSLGIVIWYFPLWHMGISGYEAFVMSTISPLLMGIKSVRNWTMENLRLVHLLSLVGVAAYLVEKPEARLATVGFGVWMSCLGWTASLSSVSLHDGRLERKVLAWMAGLVMSATAKFAWWTNNPIWPIMNERNGGLNRAGLALAVVSALVFTNQPAPMRGAIGRKGGSSFLAAVGIGGLFFGLHSLLSDTSTMILWTWDGYPLHGPQSVPHGWFTVMAMSVGAVCGTVEPQLMTNWFAYGLGCVGAAILTASSGWMGYGGALVMAWYLMGMAVPMVSNASRNKSVATTFGLGFLIYNLLVLFHVWVVAYAFVPGGTLVREHTDWIMMTLMLCLGLGTWDLTSQDTTTPNRVGTKEIPKTHRKFFRLSLVALNILFLAATYMRVPKSNPVPYHAPEKLITAGIWTIHFSLDNNMWSSEYRMRDLFKELEVDVIGVLESDLQRIIMGNRDTTQFLAEDLGMYVDYGPGPNKHTWGAALLSKFPIVKSTHHLLPSPAGELAPTIHATIDAYGELVDVFVFHSGQEEDEEDRRLQAEFMSKLMGSTDRPAFLLSYLVTKPGEGNYNTYVSEESGMLDVDAKDWDRWCEYILYKNMKRTGYARVSRSSITDTEFQVAKFVVPTTEEEKIEVETASEKRKQRRKVEREMPDGMRWPDMFRGKGRRGHRYHVFPEPRALDSVKRLETDMEWYERCADPALDVVLFAPLGYKRSEEQLRGKAAGCLRYRVIPGDTRGGYEVWETTRQWLARCEALVWPIVMQGLGVEGMNGHGL
ncbi:hypothetical protein MKZ38_000325 [Zalerion maritima]|uniref:Calcofluor white hypersensitive protein n=1 Tax=Zalerion maritima TaxID=339359 RepID=A0AAD5WMQ0_9PEZI|nr:hypothetical protein MKZ38_000325 [Zalerion maritima]